MNETKQISIPAYFREIELCVAYHAQDKILHTPRKQVSLFEVFERMYSDTDLKNKTETVLGSVGTPQYKKFKLALPAFVLGRHYTQGSYNDAEFNIRYEYPFKSLSPYFAVDVDGFKDKDSMRVCFEQLKSLPYVCCVFPSPSRLGFRAIVKTDLVTPVFERYTDVNDNDAKSDFVINTFKPVTRFVMNKIACDSSIPTKNQAVEIALNKGVQKKDSQIYLKNQGIYHLDVLEDVSRMWFFSSILQQDYEFIYINDNPVKLPIDFDDIKRDQSKQSNRKQYEQKKDYTGKPNTEIERFNKEFDLLNFLESQGFNRVGTSGRTIKMVSPNSSSTKSGDFVEDSPLGFPIYVNYSTSCDLSNFKSTNTAFSSYGCVRALMFQGDTIKTNEYLVSLGYNVKKSFGFENVYHIGYDAKEKLFVKWNNIQFLKFLYLKGFRKVLVENVDEKEQYSLIRLNGLICEKVNLTTISDYVLTQIDLIKDEKEKILVADYHATKYRTIYGQGVLATLKTIQIETFNDTRHESFIMYRNGLLKVTKDSCTFVTDIKKYVWTDNVVHRNFDPVRYNDIFNDFDLSNMDLDNGINDTQKNIDIYWKSEFFRFLFLVMNCDPKRIEQTASALGYLVNTYHDPTNPKAVIFCDEAISDNPQGGTGKGLMLKAVEKMRLTTSINGKRWDVKDQFAFAGFVRNSNVIVIDDIEKTFDFEQLFFLITTGFTVRRLYENPFTLKGSNMPKMAMTTNYTVTGDSSSHNRRKIEIELYGYFSDKHSPIDEFKKQFWGDEWTDDDWFYFDGFMINCLQLYLRKNLITLKTINLEYRKLLQSTHSDFVEFMTEIIKDGYSGHTKALWEQFKTDYTDFDNNKFKQRTFTGWLTNYLTYMSSNHKAFEYELKRRATGAYIEITAFVA